MIGMYEKTIHLTYNSLYFTSRDRVCCVFVTGKVWQFKGWKWEKPVDLFSNGKYKDNIMCQC